MSCKEIDDVSIGISLQRVRQKKQTKISNGWWLKHTIFDPLA